MIINLLVLYNYLGFAVPENKRGTRMWANAQRDGRPAERCRALCSKPQSLADATSTTRCRAVTLPRRDTRWNLQGCPKLANRSQPLGGRSSPYYGNIWRTYCCLTSDDPDKFFSTCASLAFRAWILFTYYISTVRRWRLRSVVIIIIIIEKSTTFPIDDKMCFSCEDIARQSCAMERRWRFFGTFLSPVFSAIRVQDISDLHSKFTLGPHHVPKYGRHPICDGWD